MKTLTDNLKALHGEAAERWLNDLPDQLEILSARLNLTLDPPFDHLTYHYVAPACDADGQALVLKYGIANTLEREIAALDFYQGQGAVRLLAHNNAEGWLLLERCEPGVCLSRMADDDASIEQALELMTQLWRPITPVTAPFPRVEDLFVSLADIKQYPISQAYLKCIDYALGAIKELLSEQSAAVLLHGDCHQDNILSHHDHTWRAIDPKGIIGEAAFDCTGALLRNPLSRLDNNPDLRKLLRRRLSIVQALTHISRDRLALWPLAQCVLAAKWCCEDGSANGKFMLSLAETFHSLL